MQNFLIKKNHHYCNNFNIGLTFKNKIEYNIHFCKNCLYTLPDDDIYDINKLFGISTSFYHHYSSARIGWRCLDNENIELLTYTYDNWNRLESQLLGTVKCEENFKAIITLDNNMIIYELITDNYSNKIILETSNKPFFIKYKLFPYFGGNKTAPHNMNIIFNI